MHPAPCRDGYPPDWSALDERGLPAWIDRGSISHRIAGRRSPLSSYYGMGAIHLRRFALRFGLVRVSATTFLRPRRTE